MRIPYFAGETGRDFRSLAIDVVPVMLIFSVLSSAIPRGLRVPLETFEGFSIVLRALQQPRFVLFLLLPGLALLPFWKRLRWSEIPGSEYGVRAFIGSVCLASAFTFSTYDYNLFLGQAHLLDRILMLVLAVCSFWHPVFAVFYYAIGMIVVQQFEFPLGTFDWLDKRILFVVLHLFTAFLAMATIRRQRAIIFVGLSASILAANYAFPGIAKIQTPWVLQDNLGNLAVMTHLNGWFGRVSTDSYLRIVGALGWINKPLLWTTLVVELGSLLLFLNRRYFWFIILGTVGLHFGIFFSSGICFWKWVLFNLGVLWMVHRAPDSDLLFTRGFLVLSILAILSTPFNARPSWLVWFDAPADEFTEFEAVGLSGKEYHIERGFFEPHDLVFAQNRFYFANDEPALLGTFGATADAQLDRALTACTSPAQADSLIEARATVRYDAAQWTEFEAYLRTFFATLNERGSKELWISRLRAPHHIWSQRPDPVYALQEPVREVKLVFHRVYYDGKKVHELRRCTLQTVEIPMTRAEAVALGAVSGASVTR